MSSDQNNKKEFKKIAINETFPVFSSIPSALVYIGQRLQLGPIVREEEYALTYKQDGCLIKIEAFGSSSPENATQSIEKIMKLHMTLQHQTVFAEAGFAPKVHWVKSYQVEIETQAPDGAIESKTEPKTEPETELLTIIAVKTTDVPRWESSTRPMYRDEFVDDVCDLMSFMIEKKISIGNLNMNNMGIHNGSLQILDFSMARPDNDPSMELAALLSDLLRREHDQKSWLCSSLHLVPFLCDLVRQQHDSKTRWLCTALQTKQVPLSAPMKVINDHIAKNGVADGWARDRLKEITEDWIQELHRRSEEIDRVDYYNEEMLKLLWQKFIVGSYTWTPSSAKCPSHWTASISGSASESTQQGQYFRRTNVPRLEFGSLEEAFESIKSRFDVGALIGKGSFGRVYAHGQHNVIKMELADQSPHDDVGEEMYIPYLIRSSTQVRYHALFAEKGMAPKVYWGQGFPIRIHQNGQSMDRQLLVCMMQRVDCDFIDFVQLQLDSNDYSKLYKAFLHDIPQLIDRIADCGLMHGDLHFGNIVLQSGKMKLIDFGITQPFADPGRDVCYMLMREKENILQFHPDLSRAIGIMQQFCMNMIPILEKHKSWALEGFTRFANDTWSLYQFYQWLKSILPYLTSQLRGGYERDMMEYLEHPEHVLLQAPGTTQPKDIQQLVVEWKSPYFLKPSTKGIQKRMQFFKTKGHAERGMLPLETPLSL